MWMVNPVVMCNKHLPGEHVECHMFVGHLQRKRQITNYIRLNLLEPKSLKMRHDRLAVEMVKRGMNHKSPLGEYEISYLPDEHVKFTVNIEESLVELRRRCADCRERLGYPKGLINYSLR